MSEIEELKSQNNLLKDQLAAMSSVPGRDALEGRIKELNQRNLALTVELDQERIIIDDLKDELSNARSIKQEVLERGKATKLKSDLLNEELSDAKIRIKSLEKALIASREAIRVLQGGGNRGSMIQVSNPSNFSPNLGMQNPVIGHLLNRYILPLVEVPCPNMHLYDHEISFLPLAMPYQ